MQIGQIIDWIKRHHIVILLACVALVGAFLRFYNLGAKSLWFDETESIRESSLSIQDMVASTNQPPLYFLALRGWISLFGTGEVALRSLSALFGVLAVIIVFFAGSSLFNKRTGLIGAFLAAIAYFPIAYSQDTRAYSLLFLLSVLSYWFFIEILRKNNWKFYLAYIAAGTLLLFTHFYGSFIIVSQVLFFLIFIRRYKAQRFSYLLTIVVLLVALAPMLLLLKGDIVAIAGQGFWLPRPGFSTILDTLVRFSSEQTYTGPVPYMVFAIFMLLAILGIIATYKTEGKLTEDDSKTENKQSSWRVQSGSLEKIWLLLLWLLIPILIPFIESQVMTPVYQTKYVIGAYPALCLLVASGLNSIRWQWIFYPVLLLIVIASSIGLHYFYKYDLNEQWRETASFIAPKLQTNDILMFCEEYYDVPFNYYYKGTANEMGINTIDDARNFVNSADGVALKNQGRLWLILVHDKPEIQNFFANSYGRDSIQVEQTYVGMTIMLIYPSAPGSSSRTFGQTDVGKTASEAIAVRALIGSLYTHTAGPGEAITRMAFYGFKSSGSGLVHLGIYDMTGGLPVNLVGSAAITVNSATPQWWYSAPLNINLTNGTTYCVAQDTNNDSSIFRYFSDVDIGNNISNSYPAGELLPNAWSHSEYSTTWVSMYATYTVGGVSGKN